VLVKNIRRGNTLIKRYNQDQTHHFFVGRRGLMKFFDLRLPFISREERNCLNIKNYAEDLHQEKNYILGPVLKAIAQGSEVQVYKTLKANGENVQVSYSKEIGAWVIASKNVGLLARTREEIKLYNGKNDGDRFYFAQLMAKVWFDILDGLSKDMRQ
jgi:hypothetical protein